MNLRLETNETLIFETDSLVREERERLIAILHRFREIERRRLYSSMGYESLFMCLVKRFGYPEDQAYRRISAMKLLNDLPEISDQIATGSVSLTHLGIAQSLFRQEEKLNSPFSSEKKVEVIQALASKPVREAQRIALSYATAQKPVKTDRIKALSADKIEIRFSASPEIEAKIAKLKGYFAHSHPNLSLDDLFGKLCDLGLQEWAPSSVAAPRKRRVSENSKAHLRRRVFARARNQCENCGSGHALQIDHIKPRALGGTDDPENLRVLCRSCNQRAAIEALGERRMERYLS